jgi:HEAT repeat protein
MGAQARVAVTSLIQALQDSDPEVQNLATKALENIGSEALSAIATALKDPNPDVRRLAAQSLGRMGSESNAAIPDLIEALKDSDGQVRRHASEALAEIGVESAPALIQSLEDPVIRRDVIYALGRIATTSTPEIISTLTTLMNDDNEDLDIRWMAAVGLDRSGIDVEHFFEKYNLPSPERESMSCLFANESWDDRTDTSRHRRIYVFDVYTQQCIYVTTIGGFLPDNPVNIYERAVEIVRGLGKN